VSLYFLGGLKWWGANFGVSYEHHSIEEPAILLGGAFVVEVVEKEREEKKA
jgi:hypothetical protein